MSIDANNEEYSQDQYEQNEYIEQEVSEYDNTISENAAYESEQTYAEDTTLYEVEQAYAEDTASYEVEQPYVEDTASYEAEQSYVENMVTYEEEQAYADESYNQTLAQWYDNKLDDVKNYTDKLHGVARYVAEYAEGYQIIGFLGCIVLIMGCFCPMFTVECYNIYVTKYYFNTDSIIMLAFAAVAIYLILKHQQKYCIVPVAAAIAKNLSAFLGISNIREYIVFKSGYYIVWTGIILILISTFCINSGYAKDSGLRRNKPLFAKDFVWVCAVIAAAVLLANLFAEIGSISVYANRIKKLQEDGYIALVDKYEFTESDKTTLGGMTYGIYRNSKTNQKW